MTALRERWARARDREDFAWVCLVTNAVGVPGIGTLMAGRWEGVAQLVLSIAGGILLTWWLVSFLIVQLRALAAAGAAPLDFGLALWGGSLFGIGWLWALASSASVLRQARAKTAPPLDGRT